MNTYIDIYCERLAPGLLAEPLNAATNIAFFIAAFFAFKLAKNENALDWRAGLLITLLFAMGTGSTLFHTYATQWAMLSDVLPILFYQIIFITLYAQKIMCLKCRYSFGLLALFFAAMYGSMQLPREWLNGSLEYAPALLVVTGLGIYHYFNATREKFTLLLAAGIFTLSLSLRSLDMALCLSFPIGTHFLWHCFNGLVLYLTTRAYLMNTGKT